MNTKFDVGQRVTYPVVQTADGNITGIAVSKAGATRYAIGARWYAEDDLKLAAEEKPVRANSATEPVKENDPVKLYCVESFMSILSAGKIYEPDKSGYITYDDGRKSNHPVSDWKFDFVRIGNLVPLVRRPAKVGEWVYINNAGFAPCGDNGVPTYKNGDAMKIIGIERSNNWFRYRKGSNSRGTEYVLNQNEYLVLDGYHGDPV